MGHIWHHLVCDPPTTFREERTSEPVLERPFSDPGPNDFFTLTFSINCIIKLDLNERVGKMFGALPRARGVDLDHFLRYSRTRWLAIEVGAR